MPAPRPFALERYFAQHEFAVRHVLSASDCETFSLSELLALAGPDARSLWDSLTLGYTETSGSPALRSEIAGLYRSAAPEDVLVMAPQEAIFISMHALLSPSDHVVCLTPCYQSLAELPRQIGCRVTEWRLTPGIRNWSLDLERLEQAIEPGTKLLVVNFPHNPTGYQAPRPLFDAIMDLAARRGLWTLSDEMYRFLEFEPEDELPAACDVYAKAISLGGLSKAFGLPGLRIGWLASKDKEFLAHCAVWRDYTTICTSAPSEALAIAALRAKDRILPRNREIVRSNLRLAEEFFAQRSKLFHWRPPGGSSVALVEWLGETPLEEIRRRLLEQGVLIVPGRIFDVDDRFFRLGMGRRDFADALEILGAVVGR